MSENGLLDWHVQHDTDVVVLTVAGEIDLATEEDFAEALDCALAAEAAVLLVNLVKVTFLGSAALHVLLEANAKARRQSRAFRVAHGGSFAAHVIAVAGLDQVLEVFDSPEAALSWVPAPSDGRHDAAVRDIR
ncbi:STAS domain-containing protein [Kibdelosporangium phytohabitans]|uniref:STAS domain-containing protein n=1 Tax=Kibdelosporangium phytohabitans TaxID=860235 RepID=UPI00146FD1A4|nr:STAS domain-containing protein [Kibdelosporangium phytohabitans]MBE1470019.1 anti-anti-sigma factor [Kibdelosporangium phytohabitans]